MFGYWHIDPVVAVSVDYRYGNLATSGDQLINRYEVLHEFIYKVGDPILYGEQGASWELREPGCNIGRHVQ